MTLRDQISRTKDLCVCILAHNEQKHIASTIKSIFEGNREIDFDVVVYANGCTDDTVEIVENLFPVYPNLHLRKLDKASKSLSWNVAFTENKVSVLIFSDGDVDPEPGAVITLWKCLKRDSGITLASCQYWPQQKELNFEKKITGLMQIPLVQDFLTGCFYGIKRNNLSAEFSRHNLTGIPDGIVGEDFFLSSFLPDHNLTVIGKKCYYEPPSFVDYTNYLARIRWQENQAATVCGSSLNSQVGRRRKLTQILKRKAPHYQGFQRLLLGIVSATMRFAFIFAQKKQIARHYHSLGAIVQQGESILSSATRSSSTK